MNKRLIAGVVIIAAVSLLAIGTAAYLVSEARTTNIITTGSVEIRLDEYSEYPPLYPENVNAEAKNLCDEDHNYPLVPGETIALIPIVTNIGTADCWVRIKIDLDHGPQAVEAANQNENVSISLVTGYENDWQKEGEWYYLKTPLAPGEETPLLFDAVSLDPRMGNEYANSEISIDILAEAIQSKNNPLIDGNYPALWNAQ